MSAGENVNKPSLNGTTQGEPCVFRQPDLRRCCVNEMALKVTGYCDEEEEQDDDDDNDIQDAARRKRDELLCCLRVTQPPESVLSRRLIN